MDFATKLLHLYLYFYKKLPQVNNVTIVVQISQLSSKKLGDIGLVCKTREIYSFAPAFLAALTGACSGALAGVGSG